jgi:hypothetical protein
MTGRRGDPARAHVHLGAVARATLPARRSRYRGKSRQRAHGKKILSVKPSLCADKRAKGLVV